jgi:hypothetical protein
MILTPFNHAEKVVEGVESFFSMQRRTLQMVFETLERSRVSRYESLSRTQISLQNATETIGQQILINQMTVRKSINQAFQLKLPKITKQWDTQQQNFSNYCENFLKQIDHSVVMATRTAEQSQKAESTAQQLSQNFLNGHFDSIQKNMLKVWARPKAIVAVEEDKEEEVLTEAETPLTETAISEIVDFQKSVDPVLTNKESKLQSKKSTEKASEFALAQSTSEENSLATKITINQKSAQRTASSRSSRRSK